LIGWLARFHDSEDVTRGMDFIAGENDKFRAPQLTGRGAES
jgi:hypothetical protein